MFTFLIVVITIIGIVMTFLVLVQAGRGGGLAGIAAGGATTQILGARQAPDVLEKATWTLAVLFIVLCILTNFTTPGAEAPENVLQGGGTEQAVPAPAPTTPAPAPPVEQAPAQETPPPNE